MGTSTCSWKNHAVLIVKILVAKVCLYQRENYAKNVEQPANVEKTLWGIATFSRSLAIHNLI
jgi:hypothetical protein